MISVSSFLVAPRKKSQIEEIVESYLYRYLPKHLEVPGVLNVENLIDIYLSKSHGFRLQLVRNLRNGVEAQVDVLRRRIQFTLRGWEAVRHRETRSMFTAAHEAYHVIDHADQAAHAAAGIQIEILAARQSRKNIEVFRDADWQANHGAGALLMPRATMIPFCKRLLASGATRSDLIREVERTYGVSFQAAETRLVKLDLIKKDL